MYLKSTESKGWQRGAYLAGLMAVTTLGVFSKESAVAILGIIVIYEIAFWKERKQLRGLLFGCAALAPPLLFLWYRRSVVLSASGPRVFLFVQNPILNATFLRGRLTAIGVMAKYLWLFLWPLKLSCDYSYNQIPVASGTLHDWVAWIAVAGVIIGAASMYRRSPTALFLAGFAFLTFVPVSNLLFLIGTIMADRFLYVPAIGCAGCLVLAIYAISRRIAWPPFAPIALCLIIAVLCIRTWERNFDWSDDVTLWTAAVRSAPNSFKSHDALAYALNQSDPSHSKINQTIEEADASLAILDPLPNSLNTAYSYVNAGNYFQTKGDLLLQREPDGEVTDTPESRLAYQISLEILLRGAAIDRATNEQHRIEELGRGKQESEITPTGLPLLYDGLAVTYLRLGDSKDAYDAAVYARLLAPQIPDTYILIGEALSTSGRKKDAAVSFMEGMLVTGDQRFFPLLQSQYRSGLDPAGCSFVQTANGPAINYSCEAVHNSVCGASAELTRVFLQGHQHDLAVALKNKALGQFGCSPEKLE
jgi:tetratricopeptide (TPR) repeat protein